MQEILRNNTDSASRDASRESSSKHNEISFTDKTVKYLKPKKKRESYWFKGMPGFGIRVTSKGTKSFIYMYRHEGQARMLTLGRYPELSLAKAREAYAMAAAKLDTGEDPAEDKLDLNKIERENPSVKQMVSKYIEYAKKTGKKTWRDDKRTFERDVIPMIGRMKVHKVKRRHVSAVVKKIVERGSAGQADHTLSYIKRLFNVALQWGYVEFNPCQGLEKIKSYAPRERVLSPKEVWKFWHGLDDTPLYPVIKYALRFTLCTMTRSKETMYAQWDQIDRQDGLWTIPKSLAKNNHEHRLPLNQLALEQLNQIHPYTGASDYVFGSNRYDEPPGAPPSDLKPLSKCSLSRAVARHRHEEINITERFTPHDLRRTAATYVVALGCPVDWAERLLNHVKGTLIRVYNRYSYDLEKRTGMEMLGYALERIISCETIDQVPSLEQLRREVMAKGMRYRNFGQGQPQSGPSRFEADISGGVTYQIQGI